MVETSLVIQILGLLGLVGGAIGGGTKAWSMLRGIIHEIDSVRLTAARLEVMAQKVADLAAAELTRNGGSSLKDVVTRMAGRLEEMEDRQLHNTNMIEQMMGRVLRQGDRIDELEHQRNRQ